MNTDNILNSGLIVWKKDNWWISWVSSPLAWKRILLESKNWIELAIPHEIQFLNAWQTYGHDTMMCVAFSWTDSLEYQFMQMIRLWIIPQTHILFLNQYMQNWVINFNERFPAINWETTDKGAYLWKVARWINISGLIPQNKMEWWATFYENIDKTKITEEQKELGLEFNKYFTINYEYPEDISDALKYWPIQACVKYADWEWILSPAWEPNHAIVVIWEWEDYYLIDDSYSRQYKKYRKDKVSWFLQYVITINDMKFDVAAFIKNNDLKFVRNENSGAFGRIIRWKLRLLPNTTDRGVLMLLDNEHRKNWVTVTDAEWNQLPRELF